MIGVQNNNMKKITIILGLFIAFSFAACERVDPNYVGVLMENFGKNGKSDYSIQMGRVSTIAPGTTLYQVPLWEQRAEFINEEGEPRILYLKSADNTEFTVKPFFAYKVIKDRAVDVVFNNAQLTSGNDFLYEVQMNVLQPKIYDILKESCPEYTTDSLMKNSGLAFERSITEKVRKMFEESGFELTAFSATIDFPKKVKDKINDRNEVNQNVLVIDQQILEQKKKNELAALKAEEIRLLSSQLTDKYIQLKAIEAWRETKQPVYNGIPFIKPLQ